MAADVVIVYLKMSSRMLEACLCTVRRFAAGIYTVAHGQDRMPYLILRLVDRGAYGATVIFETRRNHQDF